MSAFANYIAKWSTQRKEPDWDRQPGEMRAPELKQLAEQKNVRLTKYKLYECLNADVAAGTLQKRRGRDGKVYYSECLPVASTPKPRSRQRSR